VDLFCSSDEKKDAALSILGRKASRPGSPLWSVWVLTRVDRVLDWLLWLDAAALALWTRQLFQY
jgi:hypothetical protein